MRQATGADHTAVVTVLRAAIWGVKLSATEVGKTSQRGDPGSVAGTRASPTHRPWAVRDQTWEFVAERNTDSHGHLGLESAWVFGGRQRGPLRREPGWELHLESDVYGYTQRLDRRGSRME